MKKFIFRILTWFLIFYCFSGFISMLLDEQFSRGFFYTPNILCHSLNSNNIIIGSSRSLTGINTPELEKSTNQDWYNFSMDDTPIESHLLVLETLIEKKVHLDTIILQYDGTSLSNIEAKAIAGNDYRFLPLINKFSSVDRFFKKKQNYLIYKYLPITKYFVYNTELLYPTLYTLFNSKYRHRFDEHGDYSYPNAIVPNIDEHFEMKVNQLSTNDTGLRKFINLCVDNNIKLIIYTAPLWNTKIVLNDSGKILSSNGVSFIDFSTKINHIDFFYDHIHVNKMGKDSLTVLLANEIK